MFDFAEARRLMVEGQIRTADVTDPSLLAAMLEVPRESFLPADQQLIAYLDRDVELSMTPDDPVGRRCLLKPMTLAKLIHAASIDRASRVLDVGCATGYSSAILASIAGRVVALEQDGSLARTARQTLAGLGLSDVTVVQAALRTGASELAPFDVILLEGATEITPQELLGQLREGGRLLAVVGRAPAGKATLYRLDSGHVSALPLFDASAPLLPGFAKPEEFVF